MSVSHAFYKCLRLSQRGSNEAFEDESGRSVICKVVRVEISPLHSVPWYFAALLQSPIIFIQPPKQFPQAKIMANSAVIATIADHPYKHKEENLEHEYEVMEEDP
ncbi:hypothetical protein GW17_00007764 [Ensete ventricosum]|nr:hypothetical protein GW17_00007764 [Ensete ventricosum]RZR80356.1 hypothetical protein BHM03_00006382 [Ensete ventricosum]